MRKNLSESILYELKSSLVEASLPDDLVNLTKLAEVNNIRKMHDGNYKFEIDGTRYTYNTKMRTFNKFTNNAELSSYTLDMFYFKILNHTMLDLQAGNKTVGSLELSEVQQYDKDRYEYTINGVLLHIMLPSEISFEDYGVFTSPTYNEQTGNIDYFSANI